VGIALRRDTATPQWVTQCSIQSTGNHHQIRIKLTGRRMKRKQEGEWRGNGRENGDETGRRMERKREGEWR
jgi:hypothetical protein